MYINRRQPRRASRRRTNSGRSSRSSARTILFARNVYRARHGGDGESRRDVRLGTTRASSSPETSRQTVSPCAHQRNDEHVRSKSRLRIVIRSVSVSSSAVFYRFSVISVRVRRNEGIRIYVRTNSVYKLERGYAFLRTPNTLSDNRNRRYSRNVLPEIVRKSQSSVAPVNSYGIRVIFYVYLVKYVL